MSRLEQGGGALIVDNLMTGELRNIRKIEDKYGMVVFRCGLQHMMECGMQALVSNPDEIEKCKQEMLEKEKQSTGIPIMTANFQCGIVDCAVELAHCNVWDLIRYIKDYVTCNDTRDYPMSLNYANEDSPNWQGSCPRCGYEFNSELVDEYNVKFCPQCGQAIDIY